MGQKQFQKFLYSVAHVERYRAKSASRRGRPSKNRENYVRAASILRGILQTESKGRISVHRFICNYVPILNFPSDVQGWLRAGDITLTEAHALSRVNAKNLRCKPETALSKRAKLLDVHLDSSGSQNALKARVNAILKGESKVVSEIITEIVSKVDEKLAFDEGDVTHAFWEEMKEIVFGLREITSEDLDDELYNKLEGAIGDIYWILGEVKRRRNLKKKSKKIF